MAQLDYQYIGGLVEQVQQGDSNAFAELYAATYQKQYFAAYKYLRDDFLAQDALQETYITALKNINSLRDAKLFISWLNQINFRTCFRLNEKHKQYNLEMAEFNTGDFALHADMSDNPESIVVQIDEEQFIARQVLDLPFSESQALLLRYYNNLTIEETAEIMGCSKSSVKRYTASGLNRLRVILNK
ncbi:MAG: RNA polymerase sigma factor [Firmicutes bacterium]|nr:RNA polymerase sigma factor [Bacillota bacterium]